MALSAAQMIGLGTPPAVATQLATELALDTNRLAAIAGTLPAVASYLGPIATGCQLHNQLVTSKQQLQSRSPHFMRDSVNAVQIVLPGFYVNGASGEKTTGSPTTYTASIEYPAGTFTQVTFGGAVTGIAVDGGMLFSDFVTVAIPRNALFWVQVFGQNATAIGLKLTGLNTMNGAKLAYASSGLTDQTLNGAITNSGTPTVGTATVAASGYAFFPCAILGMTTQQSFYMMADSRGAGSNDAMLGINADQGNLARSIGPFAAYINGGVSGDTLEGFLASNTNRLALAKLCSTVINELGINSVTAGDTLATLQALTIQIRSMFPASTPFYLTTNEPVTTSSDSWATVANQTVAATNAVRGAFNDWKRTVPAGFRGCFDLADAVEAGRNSGIWSLDNGVPSTDGTHATYQVYKAIQAARIIHPTTM